MLVFLYFFFFKQKTAYEMRISDWSSDVCSSDLGGSKVPNQATSARMAIPAPASSQRLRRRRAVALLVWSAASTASRAGVRRKRLEIGRASCRERVCQYV